MTIHTNDTRDLYGKKLTARDGEIGHIQDFYFDDSAWVIRYVVVDTGTWLTGRLVLLAPYAFEDFGQNGNTLHLKLSKKQIQDSPSIATHETVSQQFEEHYYRSYGWPVYWQGGEMWGMSGDPLALEPLPREIAVRKALEPVADRHLQSTRTVVGYHIHAADGNIGHVSSFHVNSRNWAVQELVVETGHWFSGKQILVSPGDVERISHVEKKVFVKLTKADIQRTAEDNLARVGDESHSAHQFAD